MSSRTKAFALAAEQIRPLAEGHGACFATDEIVVKGRRVGYAYREAPDRDVDSGWRFTAGDESDEYLERTRSGGPILTDMRKTRAHTFGQDLVAHCRDEAMATVPCDASDLRE